MCERETISGVENHSGRPRCAVVDEHLSVRWSMDCLLEKKKNHFSNTIFYLLLFRSQLFFIIDRDGIVLMTFNAAATCVSS
jgi:hypothetical protein